jgi:predicted MPP superfamily phosphohydrolase
MSLRFWVLAAIYHTALVVVCLARARGWVRQGAVSPNGSRFWRRIAVDALSLGVTAFAMSLVLAGALPDPPFAVIRFWSQTLFGEALLGLAFLAVLHWRARPSHRSIVLALAVLALLAIYVDAYHVEPYRLNEEEHEANLRGSAGEVPSGTLRLLHLSDIQTHRVGEFERHVVRAASALEPDLVVLTGDYVHQRLRPGRQQTARDLARLLDRYGPRPPLGIWAVQGDTDEPAIAGHLKAVGVRWLDDEVATVPLPGGRSLTLVGLSPATSRERGHEALSRLLATAPLDSLRIVLGHSPDFVLGLEEGPHVDLALAGHTHGGQVVVPFFGPPLTLSRVPRPVAAGGLHEMGPVHVHVSRGVGLERGSAPQIRFLCPPEICVLTLRY